MAAKIKTIAGTTIGVIGFCCLAYWLARAGDDPALKKVERKQTEVAHEQKKEPKKPLSNRLARESSPYLLLHAHNPVDWYPWGPEAFEKAKAEDKPILLSVGYSSCYWCHVMERESFSDAEVAKYLNEHFVCIKVDREERPDVDQIYMAAVQAVSGGGGWPMTVFLTPEGKPFYGGTYFPKEEKPGMPTFTTLIEGVHKAWRDRREKVNEAADELTDAVKQATAGASTRKAPLTRALAASGVLALAEQFDPSYGGFGFDPASPRRPKFPEPPNLVYLLERIKRDLKTGGPAAKPHTDPEPATYDAMEMVLKTLDEITRGGVRDHLAGGYHRYSTDRKWIVPHFEKMLYDNAQLATVLVEVSSMSKSPRWKLEAKATLAFIERTFLTNEGGFASSLDAETEGVEGKTYVWSREEIKKALSSEEDYAFASSIFGLGGPPNFENESYVLRRPKTLEDEAKLVGITPSEVETRLENVRAKLLEVRNRRPQPAKDDKVIASWQALAISAFAKAAKEFKDNHYLEVANRSADFVVEHMFDKQGNLLRTYRLGQANLPATLEDYALIASAFLDLYDAGEEQKRFDLARELADQMLKRFEDRNAGGFFSTEANRSDLIVRPKDAYDGVMPSGLSVAVSVLVRLGKGTGEARYLDSAKKALQASSGRLAARPTASPMLLSALDLYLDARPEDPSEAKPEAVDRSRADDVVSATTVLKQGAVGPNDSITFEVHIKIKEGWHIYANPSESETAPATTLAPAKNAPITLTSVDYPKGELKRLTASGTEAVAVYEGSVVLKVELALKEFSPKTDSARRPRLVLRYIACDDQKCLAPAELAIDLELERKP